VSAYDYRGQIRPFRFDVGSRAEFVDIMTGEVWEGVIEARSSDPDGLNNYRVRVRQDKCFIVAESKIRDRQRPPNSVSEHYTSGEIFSPSIDGLQVIRSGDVLDRYQTFSKGVHDDLG